MYNENEQNNQNNYEYHYSYRPDYTEPLPSPEPTQSTQPQKPSRHGKAKRIVAGVLAGVLVAGAAFGGGWWVNNWVEANQVNETSIQVSNRPSVEVTPVNVDGTTPLTYTQIYQANVDSCVSINVSSNYNFFGQVVQSASSGSGFIITDDGYIVTNYHVISEGLSSSGANVEVTLNDGSTYTAEVVGGDEDYDLAVLKIDPGENTLTPVTFGSSADLQVGDEVLAIGNPLGELTFSMSEGIISCVDREINVEGTPFDMIQITAAVNSGNSGGPLFNIYGEVVGIVSAKYSTSSNGTSVEGLGFAIPINDVLSMIEDIIENGQVTTRPYMGVSVSNASYHPETGVSAGAYIEEVVAGGPAESAGLQVGDVITMIDSTLITSSSDLTSAVGGKSYSAGESATITFVRDGQVQTAELTFGSTTEAENTSAETSQSQQNQDYNDMMDEFFDEYFGGRYAG